MRFIRKRGRIIPIRDKAPPVGVAAGAGLATGVSIGRGEDIKPLLSMLRKGRVLQSIGKKTSIIGAGIAGLSVLAYGINKSRNKK